VRICQKCQEEKPLEAFVKDPRCEGGRRFTCKTCKNLEAHESYLRHRKKRIAQVKAWYQKNRDIKIEYAKQWYNNNKGKHRIYGAKTRDKLRDDVFQAYGGKCVCCGETERLFLTIDHIDGNGNKHRKETLGSFNRAGITTYAWLRQNGYPKTFQCLCQNCNVGKHRNKGICPHKARPGN
jgi:hypothetical protein